MATYDLELVQGETFERTFTWKIDGTAQSVTDYTVRSQVRAREDVNSVLLLDLAPYITPAADGLSLTLRIPANVLSGLSPREFKRAAWDLFLTSTADPTEGVRLLEGAVTLDPSATATT